MCQENNCHIQENLCSEKLWSLVYLVCSGCLLGWRPLPNLTKWFFYRLKVLSEKKNPLHGMIVQLCKSWGFHGLHVTVFYWLLISTPSLNFLINMSSLNVNHHNSHQLLFHLSNYFALILTVFGQRTEAQFSHMWFGTVGSLKVRLTCLWWRTWHQQLGQPYLTNPDISSAYTPFFRMFCCFDRILMSSVLSHTTVLAQPFHNQRLHHARVLIDFNDEPVSCDGSGWNSVSLLKYRQMTVAWFILSFKMSLRDIRWNLQC